MHDTDKLPFGCELKITCSIHEQNLIVKFYRASGFDSQTKNELDLILTCLTDGANLGMFCGQKFSPDSSEMRLISSDKKDADIQYRYVVRGLDKGIYLVLLGMLMHSFREKISIDRMTIVTQTSRNHFYYLDDMLTEEPPFPLAYSDLPFSVTYEEIHPYHLRRDRIVQVEFKRELSWSEVEVLVSYIEVWHKIVMSGGFADYIMDAKESEMYSGEIYMFDPWTLEHTIDVFLAAEEAFDALVNMVGRLHKTFCPVHLVVIR